MVGHTQDDWHSLLGPCRKKAREIYIYIYFFFLRSVTNRTQACKAHARGSPKRTRGMVVQCIIHILSAHAESLG